MSPSPFHLTSRTPLLISTLPHLLELMSHIPCQSNYHPVMWAGCCAHLLISSLPRLPAHHPFCCPFHNARLSLCSHLLDLFAPFALSFSIPFPHNLFFLFSLLLLLPARMDKLCMFFHSNVFAHQSFICCLYFLCHNVFSYTFLLQGPFLIPPPFAFAPLASSYPPWCINHRAKQIDHQGADTLICVRSKPPISEYLKRLRWQFERRQVRPRRAA